MADVFGGDQTDLKHVPCPKSELSAEEWETIRKIKTKQTKIDDLNKRLTKLIEEVRSLRDKCRHRNVVSRTGDYKMTYSACGVCGKAL